MRIDNLTVGAEVTLRFHGSFGNKTYDQSFVFLGIKGEGSERRAEFKYAAGTGGYGTWEAYRYQGRWAYGSGADRLSLVEG